MTTKIESNKKRIEIPLSKYFFKQPWNLGNNYRILIYWTQSQKKKNCITKQWKMKKWKTTTNFWIFFWFLSFFESINTGQRFYFFFWSSSSICIYLHWLAPSFLSFSFEFSKLLYLFQPPFTQKNFFWTFFFSRSILINFFFYLFLFVFYPFFS